MNGFMCSRIYIECNSYDEIPMNYKLVTSNVKIIDTTYNPTSIAPSKWFDAPSETNIPTTKTDRKKTTT